MKIQIVDMTPAMAKALLEANTRNRNLNAKAVAGYARAMTQGDWLPNGEAYKIDVNGIVLDGQTRLAAVVQSGVTLKDQVLVNDLAPESQDTMDSGRKRTTADSFKIAGLSNTNVLASVARRAWQWERENYRFTNTEYPTTQELKRILEAYPSLQRSAEVGTRTNQAFNPANATATGFAHHLFHHIDPSLTAEFFAQVATGANLDEGDPILTLRNRLMREKSGPHLLSATLAIAFYIRAWNAVREGRPLLVIVQGPQDRMPMPV